MADGVGLGQVFPTSVRSAFPTSLQDWQEFFQDRPQGMSSIPLNICTVANMQVWTASSSRDIETAKAYIKGSFPSHQAGNGTGDGEVVQLVQVPNHSKEPMGWEQTLTPHKACDAFEKKSSLGPANEWLSVFAPRVRKRLSDSKLLGRVAKELNDQDVLAMGMVSGPFPHGNGRDLTGSCAGTRRSLLVIHHSAIYLPMMNGEISNTTLTSDITT